MKKAARIEKGMMQAYLKMFCIFSQTFFIMWIVSSGEKFKTACTFDCSIKLKMIYQQG